MNTFKWKKSLLWIVTLIGLVLLALWVVHYFALLKKVVPKGEVQQIKHSNLVQERELSSEGKKNGVEFTIETVAEGLTVPWSLVFTSPERILVTERGGMVRVIERGQLREKPLHTFSEILVHSEEGLMGMERDPDYERNHFLYFSLAYQKNGEQRVKIVRLVDRESELADPEVMLDDIPSAQYHAGCRIKFGPDSKLYITTGDATNKDLPQDKMSLGGKILRINKDGSIPEDNPFPGSPVWSYGHRNSQGLAWHPVTGELYATEHGPSGFDGPAGGDEVNRIIKGENYGWPLVSHENTRAGTKSPLVLFTPAEAPSGAAFYNSDVLPQFTNQFFFAALKGEGIFRMRFDEEDPDKVVEYEKLSEVHFGRIRDVIAGPDGAIYFLTSNRDGRGKPGLTDDRVMRIVKK